MRGGGATAGAAAGASLNAAVRTSHPVVLVDVHPDVSAPPVLFAYSSDACDWDTWLLGSLVHGAPKKVGVAPWLSPYMQIRYSPAAADV